MNKETSLTYWKNSYLAAEACIKANLLHKNVIDAFAIIQQAQDKLILDLIECIEGRTPVLSDMENITLIQEKYRTDQPCYLVVYKNVQLGLIFIDILKQQVLFKPS